MQHIKRNLAHKIALCSLLFFHCTWSLASVYAKFESGTHEISLMTEQCPADASGTLKLAISRNVGQVRLGCYLVNNRKNPVVKWSDGSMQELEGTLFLINPSHAIVKNEIPASQQNVQNCIKDIASVDFVGKIWRETFPGRPNYTSIENGDEPETVWILTVDTPRCVIGESIEDSQPYEISKVSRFQLVLTPTQYKNHQLVENRAEVKGLLFRATNGHHHTKVLIEVKEIKAATGK